MIFSIQVCYGQCAISCPEMDSFIPPSPPVFTPSIENWKSTPEPSTEPPHNWEKNKPSTESPPEDKDVLLLTSTTTSSPSKIEEDEELFVVLTPSPIIPIVPEIKELETLPRIPALVTQERVISVTPSRVRNSVTESEQPVTPVTKPEKVSTFTKERGTPSVPMPEIIEQRFTIPRTVESITTPTVTSTRVMCKMGLDDPRCFKSTTPQNEIQTTPTITPKMKLRWLIRPDDEACGCL